jgi:membrane protein
VREPTDRTNHHRQATRIPRRVAPEIPDPDALIPSRRTLVLRLAARRLWRTVRDVVRFMIRRADEERLFQVASSLTFTTTLSLVPLATTVFGVMTALPVFNRFRDALRTFLESRLMPDAISGSIFKYLDQFSANASSLTIVSVLSFAVTSLTTMLTIDHVFNTIWRVRKARPLPQRLVTYWAILSIGPVLLGVSLTTASYLARASAGIVNAPPFLVTAAFDLIPIVLFTLAYAALYVFVPNRQVAWRDAFVGAFIAALAFEAAKRGFAIYVTRFPTFTIIYGALAAIPLLLLWIYYIWIVTLAGALITASMPALHDRNWNRGQAPGDAFGDALRVLRALYRARADGGQGRLPGLLAPAIRRRARLDSGSAEAILAKLEQDGIVIRTRQISTDVPRRFRTADLWLFAADASVVTLERVFRLFALDAAHVATVGLDDGDPLAQVIRRQRLADGMLSLAQVFDGNGQADAPHAT